MNTEKPADDLPRRFIQIDEEGYPLMEGVRVNHEEFGQHLLENLRRDQKGYFYTEADGHWVIVEAFDQPLIAQQIEKSPEGQWSALMPFGLRKNFDLSSLTLDEWDRFHGRTPENIPFVMSRKAQNLFFDALDSFTDESITADSQEHQVHHWLQNNPAPSEQEFWDKIFQTEDPPGFELGRETPILSKVLPQLKMPRQRALVLGCGSGNDAAFLAQQGHLVTGVDFSPEAIERAQSKYANIPGLSFIQADIFKLGVEHFEQYDLIFEHTCYCAIDPERRNELMNLWLKLLAPQGHLLGIFFVFDRPVGPPYGGSEWEIRERLKNKFRFLYWTRWRDSLPRRQGKELVVYAQKKG